MRGLPVGPSRELIAAWDWGLSASSVLVSRGRGVGHWGFGIGVGLLGGCKPSAFLCHNWGTEGVGILCFVGWILNVGCTIFIFIPIVTGLAVCFASSFVGLAVTSFIEFTCNYFATISSIFATITTLTFSKTSCY